MVGMSSRSNALSGLDKVKRDKGGFVEGQDTADVLSPNFEMASLPAGAIHRYLLHHGLLDLDAQPSLREAVRPTPAVLASPRTEADVILLAKSKRRQNLSSVDPPSADYQPIASQLKQLTAFDDAQGVLVAKLQNQAQVHWDSESATPVREMETIATFMLALRGTRSI